jgi:hypothetical protein
MSLVKRIILLLTNEFTLKYGLFTKIMLLNKIYIENILICFMKEVGDLWKFGDQVQGYVGQYVGESSQSLITRCVWNTVIAV